MKEKLLIVYTFIIVVGTLAILAGGLGVVWPGIVYAWTVADLFGRMLMAGFALIMIGMVMLAAVLGPPKMPIPPELPRPYKPDSEDGQ